MIKIIFVFFTGIATSLFLFPFDFAFLPNVNTKMMMALMGAGITAVQMIRSYTLRIQEDFVKVCLWAAFFSLFGVFSVIYNNTPDYAYASYLVSMLVWLSAAYAVCQCIRWVHGKASFRLLTNYLIGVCLFQCVIALLINFSLPIKTVVDSYISQGQFFYEEIGRLYGIGASLDVAGIRFAVVLVLLMHLICVDGEVRKNKKCLAVYITAFTIIAIVGNMIARTTSAGMLVAMAYAVYATKIIRLEIEKSSFIIWKWMLGIFGVITLVTVFLYHYNEDVYDMLRFGFEGFFNWVEHGKWETNSTDHLKNMWVWPESDKTWLIGDGYFNAPEKFDTEHKGIYGFYMHTDIGYLRFIWYCGLPGLIVFCLFLFYLARLCARKYTNEKMIFYILFVLQLVIFTKVATDIFLIYAFYYSANIEEKLSPAYSLKS